MKHKPLTQTNQLPPNLNNVLQDFREERNFDPKFYVETKSLILHKYMSKARLETFVVAISGGIDSAVVLGITAYTAKKYGYSVEAVTLPNNEGMDKPSDSIQRAKETGEAFNVPIKTIDITNISKTIREATDSIGEEDDWSVGQLAAYTRTPVLYYITSRLTTGNKPGIIVGTTNRDEGAYLGYVGKASDGMVDLQLISDVHKSEVIQIAKYLEAPESVINVTPSGDMYDGRTDEEVFGASYDFVELYLNYRNLPELKQNQIYQRLPAEEQKFFIEAKHNLDNLHAYNQHKYQVGSPAYHLDILPSAVANGWQHEHIKPINYDALTNQVNIVVQPENTSPIIHTASDNMIVEHQYVIGQKETTQILGDENNWVLSGIDGHKSGEGYGTWRKTFVDENYANILWKRLRSYYGNKIFCGEPEMGDDIWLPIGISPVFRLISYDPNSKLIPHYDAPFVYSENQKTLRSLVVTLEGEGNTRFYDFAEREQYEDEPDWNELPLQKAASTKLNAISFPHRVLHDGNGLKTVLRSDVIFRKAGCKW